MTYALAMECVASVYSALDASDGSRLSSLFDEEAIWYRADGDLRGRGAIEEMAARRDLARKTAHVVGNMTVVVSKGGCAANYYLNVYVAEGGTAGRLAAILLCEDRLLLTEDGYRVNEKRSKVLMQFSS